MKKVLLITIGLLGSHLFAQGGPVVGQRNVQIPLVTWTSGDVVGKTRLKLVSPDSTTFEVFLDTSATGQAGEWAEISGTADSCSQPFLMAGDSSGSLRPVWENRLWQLTKAADADSSTHQYRVQTRERAYHGDSKRVNWTPWTAAGANLGSNSVAMQDTILMPNVRISGSKVSQYSFFYVAGTQARLCPDAVAGTGTAIGDSVIVDSLRVFVR